MVAYTASSTERILYQPGSNEGLMKLSTRWESWGEG